MQYLVLLLVDSSEPIENIDTKYVSCRQVLEQLHINPAKILVLMNKMDLHQGIQLKRLRQS